MWGPLALLVLSYVVIFPYRRREGSSKVHACVLAALFLLYFFLDFLRCSALPWAIFDHNPGHFSRPFALGPSSSGISECLSTSLAMPFLYDFLTYLTVCRAVFCSRMAWLFPPLVLEFELRRLDFATFERMYGFSVLLVRERPRLASF